jgi:hypothetical protein
MSALPSTVELDAPIVWLSCESPCDACPLAARCRDEKLACEQFRLFYRRGGKRWKSEPREPSAQIYRRVFKPVNGRPRKIPKTARRAKVKVKRAPRAAQLNAVMLAD